MCKINLDIIIPFKDAADFLPDICSDLESQKNQNFTVYFVSDCSTDGSLLFLKRNFNFTHYVLESQTSGPGGARNEGIDHSKGDYILLIDADDRIDTNYTDRFYTSAVKTSADIIECMYQSIDPHGNVISGTNVESFISASDRFEALLMGDLPRLSWGKAYNRELLNKLQARFPPNVHNGEDHIFLLQAYSDNPSIAIICEHLYQWIRRPTSLTNRIVTEKTIDDFIHIAELKTDLLNKKNYLPAKNDDLFIRFSRRCFKEARSLISKIRSEAVDTENLTQVLRHRIHISFKLEAICNAIKNDSTSYWHDVMG